jgi:hypothetical protein
MVVPLDENALFLGVSSSNESCRDTRVAATPRRGAVDRDARVALPALARARPETASPRPLRYVRGEVPCKRA